MADDLAPGWQTSGSLYFQPVIPLPATAEIVTDVPACEVCGETCCVPRFALPGLNFRIVDCRRCGLGTLWPRPTPAQLSDFYPRRYYGSSGQKFLRPVETVVRLVAARHARFFAHWMPRCGRVLDVGCGRGVTLRGLADAGFETHGFEVSAAAVVGVDPRTQICVAASLQEARYPADWFDEIIIWHVLEHVPDPRRTLEEAARILKPGGTLIVAVPNYASWQSRRLRAAWFHLDPPRHLYHFPLSGLRQLLLETGLRPDSEHHFSLRQNPFGWIQSLQNLCPWLPRNGLYVLLQRLQADSSSDRWPLTVRLQLWAICLLLTPAAILLSVLETVFRQGATVHVVARRAADQPVPEPLP